MRTIQVDWTQDHTTILVLHDDGRLEFDSSSTDGPTIERIIDPDGGSEIDRDAVLDFIAWEVV